MKKKKVLLMTATGSYNLGDELILQEELRFLQKHYGGMVDFTIFTHDKKSAIFDDPDVTWVTYFPHNLFRNPLGNIWYFLQNLWIIAHSDILIIGGGGLFFDNEEGVSFRGLILQWFFRTKIARMAGTTIVFLGISLEIKQVDHKIALKKIFKPGDFIIVRDEKSVSLLEALEIPSSQIHDLAFLHEPPPKPPLPTGMKKRVGISIRGGFLGDSESYIPEFYDFLIGKGYDPIFLIHTSSGDEEQNDVLYIKKIMKGKTYNTTGTIENTMKVYPTLFAVIGMRFHSAVLACVHDIPFFLLSYGPKTEGLISLIEMEEFIMRANLITMERLTKHWENLEKNYERRVEHMKSRHEQIRNELITKLRTL